MANVLNRTVLFLLFICISLGQLFSQGVIHGKIQSKEDGKPLDGALIIYGDRQDEITFSNISGTFVIPEKILDTIRVQNLGYKPISISYNDLLKKRKVELELSPYELPAIEIGYIEASKLLDKAIRNTNAKLSKKTQINYLLHSTQTNENGVLVNDLYAKYTSVIKNKVKSEGSKSPYELRLVNLFHTKKTLDIFSQIPCEYHPSRILKVDGIKERKVTISYSADNSIIYLKIIPKKDIEGSVIGSFIINSTDTTIQSITLMPNYSAQEDGLFLKYGDVKARIKNKSGYVEYQEHDGAYFFAKAIVRYAFEVLDADDKVKKVTYYEDVKAIGFNEKAKSKGTKLSGMTTQLLNLENTTDNQFWKN